MKKIIALILAVVVVVAVVLIIVFAKGCNNNGSSEDKPLLLSSQELDKIFKQFFASSAPDSQIVGMPPIGMLGNDAKGNGSLALCGFHFTVLIKGM